MAYFTYFPGQMVEGTTIYQDADTLFPRFILIDKEGNWVDTEALRPSNPALKKLLKNLLKK